MALDKTAAFSSTPCVLEATHLQDLLDALEAEGFRLAGPIVEDGSIVYKKITGVEDLPYGYADTQTAGAYRLKNTGKARYFDCHPGSHTWKQFLFTPEAELFSAVRTASGYKTRVLQPPTEKYALIGVRPCELKALNILALAVSDSHADAAGRSRFEALFKVAVNCSMPGGNCFCVSMNAGPVATSGFDLCLTELTRPRNPLFLVESGSIRGTQILKNLPCRPARPAEQEAAQKILAACAAAMPKTMDTRNLQQILYEAALSEVWSAVAKRCLACGSCTLVCPTCFCFFVTDHTDISGQTAVRRRGWDSCFNQAFSYIHGGSVRTSILSRYRQWLTHKLAAWQDQFFTGGCVGCGRCITWCPAGIDCTEVVSEISRRCKPSRRPHAESCDVGD